MKDEGKARDHGKQGDAPVSSTVKAAKKLRIEEQTPSTVKTPRPEYQRKATRNKTRTPATVTEAGKTLTPK